MAKQFHMTTIQVLFLYKRVNPDGETLVLFLIARVKLPNKDGWGKLRYGPVYLKGVLFMKKYPFADTLSNIGWWAVHSFRVHWESKGHSR